MKNKYSTSAEQQTGEMPGKIMPPHFTCFLCTSLFQNIKNFFEIIGKL
jgi:hypothetical protein